MTSDDKTLLDEAVSLFLKKMDRTGGRNTLPKTLRTPNPWAEANPAAVRMRLKLGRRFT